MLHNCVVSSMHTCALLRTEGLRSGAFSMSLQGMLRQKQLCESASAMIMCVLIHVCTNHRLGASN